MKHFTESEFTMGGVPCFDKMDKDFLIKLDKLRELCGFPFTLTSTYRDEAYNKSVGGSKHSQHLEGKAVDIRINFTEFERQKIIYYCGRLDLSYIFEPHCVHVDNRDNPIITMWGF